MPGLDLTPITLAPPTPRTVGAIPVWDGSGYDYLNYWYDPRSYGTVDTTGVASSTTAVQAAIDAAEEAGGGAVVLPEGTIRCNVTTADSVTIHGARGAKPNYGSAAPTILKQAAAGAVIDTPVGAIAAVGVYDLAIQGIGAGTVGQAIRFRNVSNGVVKRVTIDTFDGEGILQEAGLACVYEDILAVNCVLDRTQSAVIGAIDINGTDHWLSRIEATISGSVEGTVQSASLYHVAFAIRQTNGFHYGLVGEISDVGIYVSGDDNRFTDCRADLNYGHGFQVVSGAASNQFANCFALNNSQDTTNVYDGWNFANGSINNQTVGCQALSSIAKVHRYGFYDDAQTGSQKNRHSNALSVGASTAPYRNSTNSGSAFAFPTTYYGLSYSATIATDVSFGGKHFEIVATNGTAFTISNPTNMVYGQEITYVIGNGSGGAMGTITWGGEFRLAGAFTNPANNKYRTISFAWNGNSWLELSRAAADI